eukprot:g1715.t1
MAGLETAAGHRDRLAALSSKFYDSMDCNGDGLLSVNEFVKAFKDRAKRISSETTSDVGSELFKHPIDFFTAIDQDESGTVDKQEFCSYVLSSGDPVLLSLISAHDDEAADDKAMALLAEHGQFEGITALTGSLKEEIDELTEELKLAQEELKVKDGQVKDLQAQVKAADASRQGDAATNKKYTEACRENARLSTQIEERDGRIQELESSVAEWKAKAKRNAAGVDGEIKRLRKALEAAEERAAKDRADLHLLMEFAVLSWGRERLTEALNDFRRRRQKR